MKELWQSQIRGVMRMELAKALLGRRALPNYLLAALPVAVCALIVLVSLLLQAPRELSTPATAALMYAVLYRFSLVVIYLGCVWTFMNLFRGEVLDRSLHFYFLCPIRREVLLAGKFLTGWIASSAVFVASTLLSQWVLYGYFGPSQAARHLLQGAGLRQSLGYAGVTVLACLGYGAVFVVIGLLFRNPLVPAVVIFLWEGLVAFLPPLLKKFSVIFYLQSLLPVPLDDGPFALIAEPVSALIAVPGLILFTAAMLGVAALRIRKMEIAYGVD